MRLNRCKKLNKITYFVQKIYSKSGKNGLKIGTGLFYVILRFFTSNNVN